MIIFTIHGMVPYTLFAIRCVRCAGRGHNTTVFCLAEEQRGIIRLVFVYTIVHVTIFVSNECQMN